MAWDPDDVARSVRRTVAEWLGRPWQLDLERKEVADDARPAGVVEVGRLVTRQARSSVPQGNVTAAVPVTVTLYPEIAEPRQAGRAARALAAKAWRIMAMGPDGILFPGGRPAAGPERWPLYDYSLVPLIGTALQRSGPVFPHDVLVLEDYGAEAIQDPLDPERWSVVLELRVSFEMPGRVLVAPTVRSMELTLLGQRLVQVERPAVDVLVGHGPPGDGTVSTSGYYYDVDAGELYAVGGGS